MPDTLRRDTLATLQPSTDLDADATLDRIAARLESEIARPAGRRTRRRRPRSRRATILFASLCILVVASAAFAAPVVKRYWFGDDPEAPANKMEVLQDNSTASSDVTNMSIFSTVKKSGLPPQSIQQVIDRLPPDHGTPLVDQAQQLLTFFDGDISYEMIGIPTTTGHVCVASGQVAFGRSGIAMTVGCGMRLDGKPLTVSFGQSAEGGVYSPWLYSGLLADGVTAVDVRIGWDGPLEPADLGRNAWVWRGSDPSQRPRQLVVTFEDGTTHTYSASTAVVEDVAARTPPTN